MSDASDIASGPEPHAEELEALLQRRRPLPAAGFRGVLGRHLAAEDQGYGPRPAHLRRNAALYGSGGMLIFALGALQAFGVL